MKQILIGFAPFLAIVGWLFVDVMMSAWERFGPATVFQAVIFGVVLTGWWCFWCIRGVMRD